MSLRSPEPIKKTRLLREPGKKGKKVRRTIGVKETKWHTGKIIKAGLKFDE